MMSDYKRFIGYMVAAAAEKRLSFADMGRILRVHEKTVRNWISFRTMMPADAAIRAIQHIMGGIYQC